LVSIGFKERMFKLATIIGLVLLITLSHTAASAAPWVSSDYHRGDFKLVSIGHATGILISPDDFKVGKFAGWEGGMTPLERRRRDWLGI
jgi:hypothetical protein